MESDKSEAVATQEGQGEVSKVEKPPKSSEHLVTTDNQQAEKSSKATDDQETESSEPMEVVDTSKELCSINSNIYSKIFGTYQNQIEEEEQIREKIREKVRALDTAARELLGAFAPMHQQEGMKNLPSLCQQARLQLKGIKEKISDLASDVPAGQYYRFNDHWRFVMQRVTFLVALLIYLEGGNLARREEICDIIGVKVNREEGFHLDLEDYLVGLLQLASELGRFAVNSVIAEDYGRPVQIAKFITELNAGFRVLNLKNDSLRKRYDGLKYDVKKVEEVVYDLSVRGLKPKPT